MARKTPEEQEADLLKRKAQIEERLNAIRARRNTQNRKDDTRWKIIAGAFILAHTEQNLEFRDWFANAIKKTLTKPADVALCNAWIAASAAVAQPQNLDGEILASSVVVDPTPLVSVSFPERPTSEVTAALKAKGFRWNSERHRWEGRMNLDEARPIAESAGGKVEMVG